MAYYYVFMIKGDSAYMARDENYYGPTKADLDNWSIADNPPDYDRWPFSWKPTAEQKVKGSFDAISGSRDSN